MSFNCRFELQMRSIAFIMGKTIEKHIANLLLEFDEHALSYSLLLIHYLLSNSHVPGRVLGHEIQGQARPYLRTKGTYVLSGCNRQ